MSLKKIKFRFDNVAKEQAGDAQVVKLYIYDDVTALGDFNWKTWKYDDSETSAKFMRDQLDAISPGTRIELHINSAGGEVAEGVTIYNLLKQKAAQGNEIHAFVDGMAYSVAMVIAMAAERIHMGLGTSMLVHYPWMNCVGNSEQLRNYAAQLDALGESSLQLFLHRAAGKIGYDELDEMMRKETMLDPESCVKYGFADVIDEYEAVKAPETEQEKAEQLQRTIARLEHELAAQQSGTAQICQMLEGLASRKETPEAVPEEKAITPEETTPGFDMHRVMVAALSAAGKEKKPNA